MSTADEQRRRFEAEVLPHLDAVHRFARWLAHSPGDADDLVQEAILRAFRAFESLRGSDVKAWLLAIVRNCHSTAVQQRQRRAFVELPDPDDPLDGAAMVSSEPDPQTASIQNEDTLVLARLIAQLPEEHRVVLLLREIEGLSYREIATITQMAMGTVMSRLARARAALKASARREFAGAVRELR